MKHLFLIPRQFYRTNGLFGTCFNSICEFRGGEESLKLPYSNITDSSSTSKKKEFLDAILNDDQISERAKKPFRSVRESAEFDDYKDLQLARLRASLIEKAKHPFYSKVKGKIPYALLTPFTFGELSRLASYRLAGLTSAPFTINDFIGFSMPCAITFSMLEMYVPDKFKFPCKCAKWGGGIVFYGVCSSVDFLTTVLENKLFGEELPIDAPQLIGTLPQTSDFKDLKKFKKLAESIIDKSPVLD